MNKALGHWLLQNGVAFDQQLNAITGGWADETLSSRCYRKAQERKIAARMFLVLIDGVFRILVRQTEHCKKAYTSERMRLQLAPEFRDAK